MILRTTILFILSLLLFSCQEKPKGTDDGKPVIVTTTGMVADAVSNLVGEHMEVKALMGPGVDPHLYQASPGDLSKLQKADLIVFNGLYLEGKLNDILEKLSKTKAVINYSDAVDKSDLIELAEVQYEGHIYDPHIWFDIKVWNDGLTGLASRLMKMYPDHSAEIKSNLEQYSSSLANLQSEMVELINTVPEDKRVMVTSHDAFQYFGRMLNIRVEALQGISTATEFGLQDRKQLVDMIIEDDLNAIFIESSVGDKPIKAILADCKQRGKEIELGGTLFSDAMGEANTAEGTYIGMLKHNVTTVVNGLK